MNKARFQAAVLLLLLISLAVGDPATAAPAPEAHRTPSGDFKPGELLLRFEADVPASVAADVPARYGTQRVRTLYHSDVEVWRVPQGQELALAEQLSADPSIAYAEPNYVYRAFVEPNDPDWIKQWALQKVGAPAAWDLSTGSADVIVAIIDTGVDDTHPDLVGKLVDGYDFVDYDTDPHDLNGHGTHCAGIAAAAANNGTGIAGLDWQARIMPIRALNERGNGYVSDITDGIIWAYEHGAIVLSLSLGGLNASNAMQDAINDAHAAGSLVVAAMGNDRQDDNPTNYPAACNNVVAVAATDPNDQYAPYSQFGSHCDIAAPGGVMSYYHDPNGIYSTMPTYPVYLTTQYSYDTHYDYLKGTSQATPHVAGLASLIWAINPGLAPDQVQDIIESTAVDLGGAGWDPDYGHGRIDALAALGAVPPPLPGAPTLLPIDNSDGDYLVDWDDVPNADSYTLEEDDDPNFGSPLVRYTGPDSQFQVVDQLAGTWHYRVRASNVSGESPWSAPQSVEVVLTLYVWPSALHFVIEAGQTALLPRTVYVESNATSLGWTASISPSVGWLEATPLSGVTPGVIEVVAHVSGSSTLFLETDLIIAAEPAANSPQVVHVTLMVVEDLHDVYLPVVRR